MRLVFSATNDSEDISVTGMEKCSHDSKSDRWPVSEWIPFSTRDIDNKTKRKEKEVMEQVENNETYGDGGREGNIHKIE